MKWASVVLFSVMSDTSDVCRNCEGSCWLEPAGGTPGEGIQFGEEFICPKICMQWTKGLKLLTDLNTFSFRLNIFLKS